MLEQTQSHSNLTSKLRKRARQAVSRMVNTQLTMLHWKIGKRIRQEVLQNQRAGYGEQIVSTLFKNDLEHTFYTQMCRIEKWSVRTLRKKIRSMLFERTAISQKPQTAPVFGNV